MMNEERLRMRDGGQLPPEMLAQLKRLVAKRNNDIDTRDMREVSDWSNAFVGKHFRQMGRRS
ncbi:hypothetical protein ABAC402_12770 [Asticcacaulis sp. AC402]|nr:hypothetical protein ABAC402_12770 [Asticcacaulis sp. AC402]